MPCLVKILKKASDKKFVYLLTKVLDPCSPSPSLDLVRKKQNSLKTIWLNVALLKILKSQFGNH